MDIIALTAADRCDRCGAQAYTVARKADLDDLMFCNHHLEKHRDALLLSGFELIEDVQAKERDGVLVKN